MEHQLKNPFEVPFAQYRFEELANWKNNVLQLDATSRLYAQRVDFLHVGALQIMGSVLTTPAPPPPPQPQEPRKEDLYDNPLEKYLENGDKLNCQVPLFTSNPTLWREICKKRDALSQLMLNEVCLDIELSVALFPSERHYLYESLNKDESVIWRLLEANKPSSSSLYVFREMESVIEDSNNYMVARISSGKKQRFDDIELSTFIEFDLNPHEQARGYSVDPQSLPVPDDFDLLPAQRSPTETDSEESEFELDEDTEAFNFDDWNDGAKSNKQKRKTGKKKGTKKRRADDFIDFRAMVLHRREVFDLSLHREGEDRYLYAKDHLLLRYIKYPNPFSRKPKKAEKELKKKSKAWVDRVNPQSYAPITNCPEEVSYAMPLDTTQPTTLFFPTSSKRQIFKEAVLPIKEMKRRIREQTALCKQL